MFKFLPNRFAPSFAKFLPNSLNTPFKQSFYINGKWLIPNDKSTSIPDPLDKNKTIAEIPILTNLSLLSREGHNVNDSQHNPLLNPDYYIRWGELSSVMGHRLLNDSEVINHFADVIQSTMPKSRYQALAEIEVTGRFLSNFSSDNVRFMAKGSFVSGDHFGQESRSYRWPLGRCLLVTPFNFPLEIPVLQFMGAVFMGNFVTVKPASICSVVFEEFLRFLLDTFENHCPILQNNIIKKSPNFHPGNYFNFAPLKASQMDDFIKIYNPNFTQFTGSTFIANHLSKVLNGRIKIEDAGVDWKIIGPDNFSMKDREMIGSVCDNDAYANTGQKCSATSLLFCHVNSADEILSSMMRSVESRNLNDLTIAPVLSHRTIDILNHIDEILTKIPGSSVICGGRELSDHQIPEVYGAIEPTAISIPIEALKSSDEGIQNLLKTEIFGPFQLVFKWSEIDQINNIVLPFLNSLGHYLTAAVVSTDPSFYQHVLSHTINGTTYYGVRGRTTGAPANHWFGPAGDTRSAGIGTPDSIRLVWSCHREIIADIAPVSEDWERMPVS